MKICTIAGRYDEIWAEPSIKKVRQATGWEWIVIRGPLLFANRNDCIKFADGDDVIFWDSDIIAGMDQVNQLLSHGEIIVSGAYEDRGDPEVYCPDVPKEMMGLHERERLGAGFLYIPNVSLQNFEDDFYFWNYKTEPGEDVGFCINAIRAGLNLYIDCDCVVEHQLTKSQRKGNPMSNSIKLQFSADEYTVENPDVKEGEAYSLVGNKIFNKDGVSVGKKKEAIKRRELEVNMLKMMANRSANAQKNLPDSFRMLDVMGALENLEDSEDSIDIDKADVDRIITAYEELAGNRPEIWLKEGRSLLKQLIDKKEVE